MVYDVKVSVDAQVDIDETISYFVNILKNPIAAKTLLDKIEEAYIDIADNPYMYSICFDARLKKDGYRKVIINNYILIYRIDEEKKDVYVVRFFYGRRNYTEYI